MFDGTHLGANTADEAFGRSVGDELELAIEAADWVACITQVLKPFDFFQA